MRLLIHGGRLIDPTHGIDVVQDLYVADGCIASLGEPPDGFMAERYIDATGHVVCPGLIDLSARLREPGQEHKATIASETRAAAASGITTLCCPPDTDPVIDTPAVVELIHQRAERAAASHVLPIGALTRALEGQQLSEMGALRRVGCVGVSNGRQAVANTLVLRRAMEYAATHNLIVFLTPEDPWLRANGCAHEGAVATRLGLPSIPEAAETAAIARDLALVEQTGVRAHFCRLSTGRAVELIGRAQGEGLPVSADVAAHQLHLTELDIENFNSQCHVIPPLRAREDRDRLRRGVAKGIIGAICSDHQPHEPDAKLASFPATEPGISALATLLPLTLRLVEAGLLTLSQALARLTCDPARILGLKAGTLRTGTRADICIFNPNTVWHLNEETLHSRGRNSPFIGWEFTSRVVCTLVEGRIVYEAFDDKGQVPSSLVGT
jgi:dihydroorotase, multifunctional complex type